MPPAKRRAATSRSSPASVSGPGVEADQLLNKDGTRRKSRVLRRKTDHSIIERRRREKINEKLVSLQNIVPACRKECQDLIERKFVTPSRESQGDAMESNPSSKRSAKRKREEEKLDRAKNEMSEKIKTTMVLEKLCIISHTLDFVVKLQEENKALRALCGCQAGRRASITSDVELEEHYRSAHSQEGLPQSRAQDPSDALHSSEDVKRPSLSPAFSDKEAVPQDELPRPAKRRLHWGSDDVREASIRSDGCRHKCEADPSSVHLPRERSSSLTEAKIVRNTVRESRSISPSLQDGREWGRTSLPGTSASEASSCHSFCRTRHSCCREEEHSSEVSSEASDDLASPPPWPAKWPTIGPTHHAAYLGRQRLPSIVNLGLPKQDSQPSSFRQDPISSLYRRDAPRPSEMGAARPFRPLSLYTSHVPPHAISSARP